MNKNYNSKNDGDKSFNNDDDDSDNNTNNNNNNNNDNNNNIKSLILVNVFSHHA